MSAEMVREPEPVAKYWKKSCNGPEGFIPAGEKPGADATAVIFNTGEVAITCDNYDNGSCSVSEAGSRCIFTRIPSEDLQQRVIDHISAHGPSSVTKIGDDLGLNKGRISVVTQNLISAGDITASRQSTEGRCGKPKLKFEVLHDRPTTPLSNVRKSKRSR